MFVSWDYAKGSEGNHDAAAEALAKRLDWRGRWYGGGNADGSGNVYVCAGNVNDPAFIIGGVEG
ncbi:MAG: hypothetical protein AAAB35_14885 [Phyllobacterium sp.]|uniref:hypothetical protein n=1 Tax=Phyllobacterium sp. TaxID=1871046 RepID=UPI0030EFA673